MKWLWFYIVCWKHRNDTRYELLEQYTLVLKAARRSAYDLRHAAINLHMADSFDKEELREYALRYEERAEHWLDIFAPDGGKDYRHNLHQEIWKAENKVTKLIQLCKDNGVEVPYGYDVGEDDIPF